MELFAYPKFNVCCNQVESRTLDYSHILTNICSHICSKGYDYCPKEHFVELCEEQPDILSKSIVVDHTDAQNVFTALRFFSAEVEDFMHDKQHTATADFISIVRNWFRACEKYGIKADDRVEYLFDMHDFLTKGIDFHKFPGLCTGRHIRGMPIQTFEAILQNIATRISLYSLSTDGTYNAQNISTLANESFFSDINRWDKEGLNSYPKAVNMPKVIGKIVSLNSFKHRTDK